MEQRLTWICKWDWVVRSHRLILWRWLRSRRRTKPPQTINQGGCRRLLWRPILKTRCWGWRRWERRLQCLCGRRRDFRLRWECDRCLRRILEGRHAWVLARMEKYPILSSSQIWRITSLRNTIESSESHQNRMRSSTTFLNASIMSSEASTAPSSPMAKQALARPTPCLAKASTLKSKPSSSLGQPKT